MFKVATMNVQVTLAFFEVFESTVGKEHKRCRFDEHRVFSKYFVSLVKVKVLSHSIMGAGARHELHAV